MLSFTKTNQRLQWDLQVHNICCANLVFFDYMQLTSRISVEYSWVFIDSFSQNELHSTVGFFLHSFLLRKQSNGALNPFEIIHPLILVFWAFTMVLIFCELGELVSSQYDQFYEKLCKCDWFLVSVEMQRVLMIVMTNSQQPIFIRGYANIVCIRNTLKTVC